MPIQKPRSLSAIVAAVAAAVTLMLPTVASASLVYDAAILAPAQGFGAAPRDLTLQANGGDTFQSGGVAWNGSAIVHGSVLATEEKLFDGSQSSTRRRSNPLQATHPIPEPETYVLMFAGLAAVGFMARRRRKV